jgi:hypothetical protein
MEKIKILLSFDHELPLGGVHHGYSEALFEPTSKILSLADALGVPVTLFTDVLCAIRFQEWDDKNFYRPYVLQISRAVEKKHDVQLHLHPHWLDTQFENGRFIPFPPFKLAAFKDEKRPGDIDGIVRQGIDFLNRLCKKADREYRCIAYRAGGYNLHPETETILRSLFKNGIRIESSINPGYYYKSALSTIDYKGMPNFSHWFLPFSGRLDQVAEDGLLEITIAGIPAGLVTNVKHVINKRIHKDRKFSTGSTIHSGKTNLMNKLKFVFSTRMLGFDVYTLTSDDLMKILRHNVKRYGHERTIVLSAFSHPKNMGDYSLRLMREFIEKSRKKYRDQIEFCTYQQICREMKLEKNRTEC